MTHYTINGSWLGCYYLIWHLSHDSLSSSWSCWVGWNQWNVHHLYVTCISSVYHLYITCTSPVHLDSYEMQPGVTDVSSQWCQQHIFTDQRTDTGRLPVDKSILSNRKSINKLKHRWELSADLSPTSEHVWFGSKDWTRKEKKQML